MANPKIKIELGSDASVPGDWFTLDDASKGLLDGSYTLADGYYLDVTAYAMNFTISRGKSRELDRYQAGHASVFFDNTKRYFDPTYTSSPFYGQIVPRRNLRILVRGMVQFTGIIDDWDLTFNPDGNSSAVCNAYDNLAALSQQKLTADTYPAELGGARINRVLNSAGVVYNNAARSINSGQMTLGSQTVDNSIGALDYIQQVELSEDGAFFIDKNANAVFHDSSYSSSAGDLVTLSDDTVNELNYGIGYQAMNIVYGSELLYNQVNIKSLPGVITSVSNTASIQSYGIRSIDEDTLLSNDAQTLRLANWLVTQYANPELRFESVAISMGDILDSDQSNILVLDIGGKCKIIYTPASVPPAITKYAEIIGIDHAADPNQHIVTLHFKTLDYQLLVLNDLVFGLLDSYYLGL